MKVLALVEGLADASVRLRLAPLVAPLRAAGVTIEIEPIAASGRPRWRQLARARAFDSVWWQRRLPQPWECAWLRRCCKRLVVDLDDAVWRREQPPHRARWREFRARAWLRRSDVVTAGSRSLAVELRELGVVAKVMPTPVAPARVPPIAGSAGPLLTWIGQPATWRYAAPLLEAWPRLRTAVPRVRWRIVGAPAAVARSARAAGATEQGLDFVDWSEEAEAAALADAWIGYAPMPDDPWTRGKCGARLLAYLAHGLPVWASRSGAQGELLERPGVRFHPLDQESSLVSVCADLSAPARGAARTVAVAAALQAERAPAVVAAEWRTLLAGGQDRLLGGGGVAAREVAR